MLMISARPFGGLGANTRADPLLSSVVPAAAPVSSPSSQAVSITATNSTFVPAATIINSTTGATVPVPAAGSVAPLPTATVDDGTYFGLTPVSWLLVGGAAYLAWKFFGHHAEKSASK